MSAELTITLIGLAIAVWQLREQQREVAKNTRINALLILRNIFDAEIVYKENLIQSFKRSQKSYESLANQVNDKLRPAKKAVEEAMLSNFNSTQLGLKKELFQEALSILKKKESNEINAQNQ